VPARGAAPLWLEDDLGRLAAVEEAIRLRRFVEREMMSDDACGVEAPVGDRSQKMIAVARRIADREAEGQLAFEHEGVVQRVVRLEMSADNGDDAPASCEPESRVEGPGRTGSLDDDISTEAVGERRDRTGGLRRLERLTAERPPLLAS
jgi:hypothetical protein